MSGTKDTTTMREIPLSKSKVALVDDEDYERVSALPWYALDDTRNRGCWYAYNRTNRVMMHTFILDAKPGTIDHINGDGLDNRRINLRLATANNQAWNTRKRRKPSSSRFKGVSLARHGRWQAKICINYKQIHIGYYGTEVEAAEAYDIMATELYGEFAKLNFRENV